MTLGQQQRYDVGFGLHRAPLEHHVVFAALVIQHAGALSFCVQSHLIGRAVLQLATSEAGLCLPVGLGLPYGLLGLSLTFRLPADNP